MWKKIILGIIISVVVLTVSAGAIYTFQKNTEATIIYWQLTKIQIFYKVRLV